MNLCTNRSVWAHSPPREAREEGVAAASIKSREATEAPQTGLVAHTLCFKTRSETSLVSDHPVRAFSERDHFFMARPPLLKRPQEEGNVPA